MIMHTFSDINKITGEYLLLSAIIDKVNIFVIIRVLFTVASKDRLFHYKRYILFIATYGTLLAYFRRLKSVLLRI